MRWSSSSEVKSTSSRPTFPFRTMRTRVPSAKRSCLLPARVWTSFGDSVFSAGGVVLLRISASVSRTESCFAMTSLARRRSAVSSAIPASARVAHRKAAARHALADLVGQLQQSHVVRDRRSIFADRLRDLLLRQMELFGELVIRVRFLDRIQILPLNVLDESDGKDSVLGNLADHDRNLEQTCALRCAPAALAGDDLVAVARPAYDDQLNHAVRANRPREILQPIVVHRGAGLELVQPESDRCRRRRFARAPPERRE